ncbi:MAG TPA: hypothetical protein VF714_04280 [Jatrophihabitans sp.]
MTLDLVTSVIDAATLPAVNLHDIDRSVDLVSIDGARVGDLPACHRLGFDLAPAWISWISRPRQSEADYLADLPAKVRYDIRRVTRWADSMDIQLSVIDEVGTGLLAEFMRLYEDNVSSMRNGHSYARDWQDRILGDPGFLMICARTPDGQLAAACLCQRRSAQSMLQLRFSARRAEFLRTDLMRLLCVRAIDEARRAGLDLVSMGSDPALYGHLTNPGLLSFKVRLGFRPVPMRTIDPGEDPDELVRVHTLRRMTDPAMLVAYALEQDWLSRHAALDATGLPGELVRDLPFKLVVYSDRPAQVNAKPFQAGGFVSVELRRPLLAAAEN